ncbi:MAG: DUF6650 family protein [Nocardioidaceae bacterium]
MSRYRVTGINLPWFGVQWEKVKDVDRNTATAVISFLEDRRLLFGDRHGGDEVQCLRSAFDIRHFLTTQMEKDIGDGLRSMLGAMRGTCRKFIEAAGPNARNFRRRPGRGPSSSFSLALGDLRSSMGFYVATLSDQYKLTVDENLASILPSRPDAEDDDLSWFLGFDNPTAPT